MAADNATALFFEREIRALTPLDPARAETFLADLAARAGEEELTGVLTLLKKAEAVSFFSAVLDLSPFIREALIRHPRILDRRQSAGGCTTGYSGGNLRQCCKRGRDGSLPHDQPARFETRGACPDRTL